MGEHTEQHGNEEPLDEPSTEHRSGIARIRSSNQTEEEIVQYVAAQQRAAATHAADNPASADGGDGDGEENESPVPHLILYEDLDFPADDCCLYIDPAKLPDYALSTDGSGGGEGGATTIYWYRPTEYTDDPDYFKSTSGCGVLREGVMNDSWLLGVFAAIALHPDNLIENLFVSESLQAFKQYGVYTCRFYKDAQWVHVTTDTRVPYSVELQDDDKYPTKGSSCSGHLLYGSSLNKNEVFIPFLEKAFAKLHGSYQVLSDSTGGNVSSKILEAFVDCTGGSAYRMDLQDDRWRAHDENGLQLWKKMTKYHRKKCILTVQLKQLSFNAYDLTSSGIIKNRQYTIMHFKEVGANGMSMPTQPTGGVNGNGSANNTPVLRFVKLKNVWGRGMWKGEWSNDDSKWEEHMQVENALRNDPACEFSRSGQDGCFWMIWEDFLDTFNELFIVHVFANEDMYQYCIQGEWVGHSAAGAPAKLKASGGEGGDGASGSTGPSNGHGTGGERPIPRTKWSVLEDAEANWYRNPQYKMTVSERTTGVLISLAQRDFRLYGGDNYGINFVIVKEKASRSTIVWEFNRHRVYAEAHSYDHDAAAASSAAQAAATATANAAVSIGGVVPPVGILPSGAISSQLPFKQVPEREIIKEDLVLEPDVAYYIIPYTDNAKVDMEFFLRVFSSKPIRLELIDDLHTSLVQSKWRNDEDDTGEASTAGGPLRMQLHTGDENPAWCQNPQFWLRFKRIRNAKRRQAMMLSKSHVTIKLVLRKTSYKASAAVKTRHKENQKEKFNLMGLVVTRAPNPAASALECNTYLLTGSNGASLATNNHTSLLRAQAKAPKTNFLGELVEKPHLQYKSSQPPAKGRQLPTTARDDDSKGNDDDEVELDENGDVKPQHVAQHFPAPKLVVKPDEWCRVSDYSSPVLSCMYLRKVPKEWLMAENGGLLVTPTLGEPGVEGTFELQVDADFPLVMDELPKFSTQAVPGEWNEANACGCHLHSEWKKNPKFYLHLKGVRPAKVKITLTRSELEWKAKCKRDAVGTMMGFYLFHGAQKLSREQNSSIVVNGRPWSETDFVPLHVVVSPPELMLPVAFNEPYVIVPATYEPKKYGKFVLSVQCDGEFTLTSESE
ncbi:TPA: hypothetical protein N0F65_000132 [Lagenidium giganteum]|uniref:Calpain catalytic domain-containing protein n=1 Tax=Lagenidium giganteum TaxID=4803 RepID=A0AAV2YX95_9STRA|nr:TPA: hypothetical protein N0F65_000132 [Lagenidium giganteum]